MDDIIQRIIDSEKLAQSIVNEARDERDAHEARMNEEAEEFRARVGNDNRARIEKYAAQKRREADEAVQHSEDAAKLRVVQLKQLAGQHKKDWVGHLYKKIIGGDIG